MAGGVLVRPVRRGVVSCAWKPQKHSPHYSAAGWPPPRRRSPPTWTPQTGAQTGWQSPGRHPRRRRPGLTSGQSRGQHVAVPRRRRDTGGTATHAVRSEAPARRAGRWAEPPRAGRQGGEGKGTKPGAGLLPGSPHPGLPACRVRCPARRMARCSQAQQPSRGAGRLWPVLWHKTVQRASSARTVERRHGCGHMLDAAARGRTPRVRGPARLELQAVQRRKAEAKRVAAPFSRSWQAPPCRVCFSVTLWRR